MSTTVARCLALVVGTGTSPLAFGVMPGVDGQGQVLIYPYYTVRAAPSSANRYNTLVSIVNSTARGKAVKLRVREGKAGAPVFEANIYMSPFNTWAGGIVPTEEGAAWVSADRTCVQPTFTPTPFNGPTPAATFARSAYATDPLGNALDRVREGFIEVIEMGSTRQGSALEATTFHVNGVPGCALGSDATIAGDLDRPSGGLYGAATVLDVADGTAYDYAAVPLDAWSNVVAFGPAGSGIPTLAGATPPVSSVIDGGKVYTSTWPTGLDAVNATLMASGGSAEFMTEAAVDGATDLAITMPTRHLAVDASRALAPFTAKLGATGACEPIANILYSRDEQVYDPNQRDSIPEAPTPYGALCWSSTVWSVDAANGTGTISKVLGSSAPFRNFKFDSEVFPGPAPFAAGVAELHDDPLLIRPHRLSGPTTVYDPRTGSVTPATELAYTGLPMIGVAFTRYVNGALNVDGRPTLSNYGANATMRTQRSITAP